MLGVAHVRVRRVYDAPATDDGYRILVDRLWPRGVAKDAATWNEWRRDVAPSTELRRWFGHDPARFAEFADRYRAELAASDGLDDLRARCRSLPVVTLLYAAKDPEHNNAVVLRDLL